VTRPPGGYRDLIRAYEVRVDGARAARVKRDGRVEIVVPAGQHDVRAVIDGFGSPTLRVDVPAGGNVELTVQPGGGPVSAAWQLRRRDTYLSLTTSDPSATVVPVPPFRPGRGQLIAMALLAAIAFTGIYFFFRGIGDLQHGGSHSAGLEFLVLGLACYLGALGVSRRLRRRRRRDRTEA